MWGHPGGPLSLAEGGGSDTASDKGQRMITQRMSSMWKDREICKNSAFGRMQVGKTR